MTLESADASESNALAAVVSEKVFDLAVVAGPAAGVHEPWPCVPSELQLRGRWVGRLGTGGRSAEAHRLERWRQEKRKERAGERRLCFRRTRIRRNLLEKIQSWLLKKNQ